MYSTTDFGNICFYGLVLAVFFGMMGAEGMLRLAAVLGVVVVVAAFLHKG
jgi:hypothetical protein